MCEDFQNNVIYTKWRNRVVLTKNQKFIQLMQQFRTGKKLDQSTIHDANKVSLHCKIVQLQSKGTTVS